MPHPSVLIALAGLPGTGKSTLARGLAAELGAPVLDKDAVRAARFGPERTDYSRAQDDACMQEIYTAAARLVHTGGDPPTTLSRAAPRVAAILDGRTFSRRESVLALVDAAREAGAALLVVECRCADAVAEARLLADASRGAHPAANRGVALYRTLRDAADPIAAALPPSAAHLVLDTGTHDLVAQVARVQKALATLAPR